VKRSPVRVAVRGRPRLAPAEGGPRVHAMCAIDPHPEITGEILGQAVALRVGVDIFGNLLEGGRTWT
jgi:hypothetical protein